MEPTRFQRFLACDGPVIVTMTCGAVAALTVCVISYGPYLSRDPAGIVLLVLSCGAAVLVGWLGTFILLAYLLFPFRRLLIPRNGGPFEIGDCVLILRGKHRDQVACIYEVWKERGQVRLDLGEPAKEQVKDVFSKGTLWRACAQCQRPIGPEACPKCGQIG